MKIKCPGCSTTLQIPDSAAGKVVKCKCGKQMRAPGAPAAGQTRPSLSPPAQPRPSQVAPNPYRPAAPSADTSGLFDELTDADLSGVKAVKVPGAKEPTKAPNASTAKMLNEAISGSDRRGEALTMGNLPPRPGFLIFVGVVNAFWALAYFGLALLVLGVVAVIPMMDEEAGGEISGTMMYLLGAALALLGIMSVATCISCIVRSKTSWYIILVSYGWGLADRIVGVISDGMGDDAGAQVAKAAGGILVGLGIWAYMHGDDVRAFYQTEKEPVWKVITVDAASFVLGGALSSVVLFMG